MKYREATDDPLVLLVGESAELAATLFGDRMGGKSVLRLAEKRIRKILDDPKFSVPDLIRQTFTTDVNAKDFSVSMCKFDSAIVQCLQSQSPGHWQSGTTGLGLPYTPFGQTPFRHAYLSPIVVRNQAIGLCFAGRLKGEGFNERECVWVDQIVDHIAAGFAANRA